MANNPTLHEIETLAQENAQLLARVANLEEALRAIHNQEVDAFVLNGAEGGQVFTAQSADRAYRVLIEEMAEGALTVNTQGVVLYSNRGFAEMLGLPLSEVSGSEVMDFFAAESRRYLMDLLSPSTQTRRSLELDVVCADGARMPVLLSVCPLALGGLDDAKGMVVTDLTAKKRSEAEIQAREIMLNLIEGQKRTQDELKANLSTLELHDSALGAISQGVLICDENRLTTYANQAFENITGFCVSEVLGIECKFLRGDGTDLQVLSRLRQAMAEGTPFHGELLNYRKDGTPFWNDLSITPMLDASAKVTQYVAVLRDVTSRHMAEDQLLLAARVFEQSMEAFVIADAQRNIVKVNAAFTTITGFAESELLGRHVLTLSENLHPPEFFAALWDAVAEHGRWEGEKLNRRKDGSVFTKWMSIHRMVEASDQTSHYIVSFIDITQRKEAEDNIRYMAHYDLLTGLPNRALLSIRAAYALQVAERSGDPLALMFIDLDHFKNVNDSLGHTVGDQLLVALASRLKTTIRDQDTLARLGGDEFVMILPGCDVEGASRVAEKMLTLLQPQFVLGEHELSITPSIGIALYPMDGTDFDALCKSADAAMYRAKRDGRNTYRFNTIDLQAQSSHLIQLENGLRRALERGQMQLHYQPQMCLETRRIIGVEALLRWQHPEMGWVSPAEFIPVAESSGLITAIGTWVICSAVQQMKQWIAQGMAPMSIAVNLSAVQFRQANLPELVSLILQEEGLPPGLLELELTESVAALDPMGAVEMMRKLHDIGIQISIDDFGTGYSSLSYLKRFKVSKLKIDQSFVRHVVSDPDDQAIVATIISLARNLGLHTIAEGVETVEQMQCLRGLGCVQLQGYWLSRPLPAEQFSGFVSRHALA